MEVPKDDLQLALQAKQRDLEALREEFQLFKEEAIEYEKELEADNQFKDKELEALKKKFEAVQAKSEEYRKEICQLEKIQDREKQANAKIKEEYELIKNNIVKIEQDNEDLESQLRNIAFEKKELKEKIERLEEATILERETLTEKLTKDQEELERLRRELEEYKEEVVVLSRKNNESAAESVRDYNGELERQNEKIRELEDEIKMLKSVIEEKNAVIKDLEGKLLELARAVENQEDLEKLTNEMEKYVGEMELIKDSHKKEIESGVAELNQQKQIVDQQGKEIVELQDEIINLRMKLDEKENKIKEKDEHVSFLTVELEAKEAEAKAELEQIEMIKHELERLNNELLEAMKEKQELAWRLQEENQKNTEHLQETEKDKEKTKQEKDKEIIFLKLELAHIKEDLAGQNEENKKLQEELRVKNAKITLLMEENSKISRGSKNRKDSEEVKGRLAREDIDKIKEENANLTKENKKLKLRIANKEKEIDQLAEEVIQMRSCIEEEKDKLMAIEKDFEASRVEKSFDNSPNMAYYHDNGEPTFEKNRLIVPKNTSLESKKLTVPDVRVRSVSPHIGLGNYNLTPVLEEINKERSLERSAEKSPESKGRQNKFIYRHLYAKLGKNGVPPYLLLDYDKKVASILKASNDMKSPRKVYKANAFDSIVHKLSDLDVKGMVEKAQGGNWDTPMLGRNLFYMIYGQRKTDKKLLKYRILQSFADNFKEIARRSENADKICKLIIRVQDNAIYRKAEILKQNTFLQQLKSYSEFQLGNDKGEKDFEDFLTQMKQIDTTLSKNVFNYGLSKGRTNPKQIFIEFSIETGSSGSKSRDLKSELENSRLDYSKLSDMEAEEELAPQPQESEYLARTKIMLVCTNSIKEESLLDNLSSIDSLIDLVMTDDRSGVVRKEKMPGKIVTDNVVKHFVMTMAPILQNYKSTFNTMSLASKINQFAKDKPMQRSGCEAAVSSSRPYFQINRNLAKEMDQWKESRSNQTPAKISHSQDKYQDKSDSASSNCLDRSINEEKPVNEKKVEAGEEIPRQIKYYSNKQETLKTNMKSVLGMLNQLMSSNQTQNPMQKIKNYREREEEESTVKRNNSNSRSTVKPVRPTSTEKTPKARKIITRVN